MRFSGLFVLAVPVGIAVSGIAAGSGSLHPEADVLESASTQQICPTNPVAPLVEPEARDVMNVDAAQQIGHLSPD
jgi:hypothetical protein